MQNPRRDEHRALVLLAITLVAFLLVIAAMLAC